MTVFINVTKNSSWINGFLIVLGGTERSGVVVEREKGVGEKKNRGALRGDW